MTGPDLEMEIYAQHALSKLRDLLANSRKHCTSMDAEVAGAALRTALAANDAINLIESRALRPVNPLAASQTVDLTAAKETLVRAFDPYRDAAQRYSETVNAGEYSTALYGRLASKLKTIRSEVVAAHDDFVKKVQDK